MRSGTILGSEEIAMNQADKNLCPHAADELLGKRLTMSNQCANTEMPREYEVPFGELD